jgi:hypothetical protein
MSRANSFTGDVLCFAVQIKPLLVHFPRVDPAGFINWIPLHHIIKSYQHHLSRHHRLITISCHLFYVMFPYALSTVLLASVRRSVLVPFVILLLKFSCLRLNGGWCCYLLYHSYHQFG